MKRQNVWATCVVLDLVHAKGTAQDTRPYFNARHGSHSLCCRPPIEHCAEVSAGNTGAAACFKKFEVRTDSPGHVCIRPGEVPSSHFLANAVLNIVPIETPLNELPICLLE